jgi:hypothetical protein
MEAVMIKKSLAFVIAGLVVAGTSGTVRAQNMDLSHIVQANMAFDQQFNAWTWQTSLALARYYRETGQPIPVNAMTLSAANRRNQQAFDAYNKQWSINSNRTHQAIDNWTTGAIRGLGPYQAPSGQLYNLPWTYNQYHLNQYGQAIPGYNPYRTNLTPYYGR